MRIRTTIVLVVALAIGVPAAFAQVDLDDIRIKHKFKDLVHVDTSEAITGTWTLTSGTTTVTEDATAGNAVAELTAGDFITIDDVSYAVDSVTDDDNFEITENAIQTATSKSVYIIGVGVGSSLDPVYDGAGTLLPWQISTGSMKWTDKLLQTCTLNDATGDEVAFDVAYTTNKATSGADTFLEVTKTDTNSPGTSLFWEFITGSTTMASLDDAGGVFLVDLDAGASGTAGTVDIFPTTASKGKLAITSADNSGDTTTTIVNASQAGARSYTIPDAGADASFAMIPTAGYTRQTDIQAGDALLGGTPPVLTVTGTAGGLAFDADAEVVYLNVEVPSEWDTASDMTLRVVWTSESGAAMANTETVKWDATYRSIAAGEAVDNGTAVTATATYTQSGAGSDKEQFSTAIAIDHDAVNQPLAAGDTMLIQFDRDMTGNTYTSDAIVLRWELAYTADELGSH